eukprot:TRINITY_DN93123_c0_g1_i1.p1 TRINITY_DN93123_c0_g1~~TRINITY_DN93123_c0_g1_i1.p1  ORF type:complete len:278 (-),score=29.64 TRINITY_DN93123_c0_g1_i1:193-1026(-)
MSANETNLDLTSVLAAESPSVVGNRLQQAEEDSDNFTQDEELQPIPVTATSKASSFTRIAIFYSGLAAVCNATTLLWLSIGQNDSEGMITWKREYDMDSSSTGYLYWTAMHWTLCQFTFAGMEIVPTNAEERIIGGVLVPLAAVLILYPCVAGIVVEVGRLYIFPRKAGLTQCRLIMKACTLLFCAMLVAAIFGLIFYAIGRVDGGWVDEYMADRPLRYTIATSMHWAVSQFTHATVEVMPLTTAGRIWAVIVQFLGFATVYPLVAGAVMCMYYCLI